MLTTNEKKSLLRVLVAGSCSAMIAITTLTADATAAGATLSATDGSTTATCLYSAQLASDPVLRNEYTTRIAMTKWGLQEESDEEIYESELAAGNAFAARFAGNQGGLDSFSNECLACHDGVMAQDFNIRIKNNPDNRVLSLEDIIGGHPVGMEYDRYLSGSKGKEYRSDVKLTSAAIFAGGKIGCLTCHNPLNTAKGHLVMNNDKSELCFSCHSK